MPGGDAMHDRRPGRWSLALAQVCRICPVCRAARRRQNGLIHGFVRVMEGRFCPFCMAYERVYGKRAHEG